MEQTILPKQTWGIGLTICPPALFVCVQMLQRFMAVSESTVASQNQDQNPQPDFPGPFSFVLTSLAGA